MIRLNPFRSLGEKKLEKVQFHLSEKYTENSIQMVSAQRNTSEGITFFPKTFHRKVPFHLNSSRNYRAFHTNGKRSVSAPDLSPFPDPHDHTFLFSVGSHAKQCENHACDSSVTFWSATPKMAVQVRVLQLEANQDLENQLYILEKGKVFLLWEPTNDRTPIECLNTLYKLK